MNVAILHVAALLIMHENIGSKSNIYRGVLGGLWGPQPPGITKGAPKKRKGKEERKEKKGKERKRRKERRGQKEKR